MALSESKAREVKDYLVETVADQARALGNPTPDTRSLEDVASQTVATVERNTSVDAAKAQAQEQTHQQEMAHDVLSKLDLPPDASVEHGPIVGQVTIDSKTGKVLAVNRMNESEWAHATEPASVRARRQRFKDLRGHIEWRHRIECVVMGPDPIPLKATKCEAIYQDSIRAFGDPEQLMQRGI